MKWIARKSQEGELIFPPVSVNDNIPIEYAANDLNWSVDSWREITEEERIKLQNPSKEELDRQKKKYSDHMAQFRNQICAPGAPYLEGWLQHQPLHDGDSVTAPGEPDTTWYCRVVGIKASGLLFGSCIFSDTVPGGHTVHVEGAERITGVFWRLA